MIAMPVAAWTGDDTTVLAVGACAAVACALPGCFLVLRGMALIGDAISHAVLPGIVVAFLLTNSLSAPTVVVGAGLVGLLTVFLIESLTSTRRVKEDASIAIVFPALFALGVLLIAQFAEGKDLDAECVFYGEIVFAPLDTIDVAGVRIARALAVLGGMALVNALFVTLLFKELRLVTFDRGLAAALGFSPVLVHYLLMGTVSVTTVASFESIGAILVVAFLIVPPATAWLLTDRLDRMLVLAAATGVAASALGYLAARRLDASVAGCMASAMGVLFALAWVAAPREGLLARRWRQRASRVRFAQALVVERLAHGAAAEERLARDLAWSRERVDAAVGVLLGRGHLARDGAGRLAPTPEGVAAVRRVQFGDEGPPAPAVR